MVNDYSYQAYTINNQLIDEKNVRNQTEMILENTTEQLNITSTELKNVRIDLNRLDMLFRSTTENLNKTRDELNTTKTELMYARQGGEYLLHNPTYAEMKSFLQNDTTDKNIYNSTTYTCSYFSMDVKNNAETQGIRCALIILYFNNTLGHAMVGFNTTDNGFIYIEPQDDKEKNIVEGSIYWGYAIRTILIIW
jgi:hypothetical protein